MVDPKAAVVNAAQGAARQSLLDENAALRIERTELRKQLEAARSEWRGQLAEQRHVYEAEIRRLKDRLALAQLILVLVSVTFTVLGVS